MENCIMIDNKLQIAVEKSNEVLSKLNFEKNREGIVSTKKILFVVQQNTNTQIGIAYIDFSDAFDTQEISNCGAMMAVYQKEGKKTADIIVNSNMKPEYQRFSLVHELGHLMTGKYNTETDSQNKKYKISAHINQNVFSIDKSQYDIDEGLLNEQIANVFALRVLIPFDELVKRLNQDVSINDVAKSFGVTREAIISRMALGK